MQGRMETDRIQPGHSGKSEVWRVPSILLGLDSDYRLKNRKKKQLWGRKSIQDLRKISDTREAAPPSE